MKNDRVGRYLQENMKEFVFAELSEGFMEKCGVAGFMKGVPVPFKQSDFADAKEGKGISAIRLSENMAVILGMDPNFAHRERYLKFVDALWGEKFAAGLLSIAESAAVKGNFEEACIYFRACLCIDSHSLKAMYGYALCCRELYSAGYENGEDDEYVGLFKAEAMDYFEQLTIDHPDFEGSYFYLGYAYLNMGMYSKAAIVWKDFMRLTENRTASASAATSASAAETAGKPADSGNGEVSAMGSEELADIEKQIAEMRMEIAARLREIEEPCEVEQGCNAVITGRYAQGLEILEPFTKGRFERWWPLYFYLGEAYLNCGMEIEAEESFLKLLTLNASHVESMQELAEIYKRRGDEQNMEKYLRKIELVRPSGE